MSELVRGYEALTRGAGFLVLPQRTLLRISGRDRSTWLNGLCTQNIKTLSPGKSCEAFITNVQGKTIGYARIGCEDERLCLETAPDQGQLLMRHFDKYIIREDVTIEDVSAHMATFWVSGATVFQQLADQLPQLQTDDFVSCSLGGKQATAMRLPAGIPLLHLYVEVETVEAIAEQLRACGVIECAVAAADAVRIEQGIPEFGIDVTVDNLPQEVNRTSGAISFTKGCYLGQETVARIDALGHVNRRLMQLKLPGTDAWPSGTELSCDGKPVARITSCAFSPGLERAVALAYVRRGFDKPGQLLVGPAGTAEVAELPIGSQSG